MIIWIYMFALVVVLELAMVWESWILAVVAVIMAAIAVVFIRKENVDEGTTVGFKLARKFACYAMEFGGHKFDSKGEVSTAGGSKIYGWCPLVAKLGGWVFYVRPFVSPAAYAENNSDADFGEGNQVFLGDIALEIDVLGAETVEPDGSNVPVSVKFLVRSRIKNPYTWTFASPKDNVVKLRIGLTGLLRRLIRNGSEANIQAMGDGPEVWTKLTAHPVNCLPQFQQFEREWGLEVIKDGVSVIDVGYPEDYQAAMQARKMAELTAGASVAETAGRIIRSVAETTGMTVNELKAALKANPKLRGMSAADGGFKEAFAYAEDQTKRDRAGGGLEDVRIGSADGAPLPASLQYLSVGGGGGAGVLVGGKRGNRGDQGRRDNPGNSPNGNPGGRGKDVKKMTNRELSAEAFGAD